MYRTLIYIYKYVYINHKGGHDLSLPVQLCKSKNLKEGEIASVKLFSSELIYTVKYFIGCLVNRRRLSHRAPFRIDLYLLGDGQLRPL